MAADIQAGFIALNRFGLASRRDGDLAASDSRGFLKAELGQPGIALLEGPELPPTALALEILYTDLEQKRLEAPRCGNDRSAAPMRRARR
jgi:uncharacterized protein (DUF1800 family)